MDDSSTGALFGAMIFLVILSAYFSGSETAMMSLNRYRLRHLANQKHGGAILATRLLERPDRLLGVILIGNNLVNFSAASVATLIALEMYGESGVALAPVLCTIVFLIFAEVTPKTIAAAYPEQIALPSAYVLQALLWLISPVVWLVGLISNGIVRALGLRARTPVEDHLTRDELRTVVDERAKIGRRHQGMLLSILDLEEVTVDDIMVPRSEIVGIDMDDDINDIVTLLKSAQHTKLPVYQGDIENVVGLLHLRNLSRLLLRTEVTKEDLLRETQTPYFVPENTPLHTQLVNFQKQKERIGLVVDEYGDIQGLVTIEDILEEIVGEFTTDLANTSIDIHPQMDGSYLIDGSAHIREINRNLGWNLPTDGPKTLNGLITDYLENIPEANVGMKLAGYHVEIVQIQDNMVRTAKVSKAPEPAPNP